MLGITQLKPSLNPTGPSNASHAPDIQARWHHSSARAQTATEEATRQGTLSRQRPHAQLRTRRGHYVFIWGWRVGTAAGM